MQENIRDFINKYSGFSELILSNLKITYYKEDDKIIINNNFYNEKLNNIIKKLIQLEKEKGYIDRSDVIDIISREEKRKFESNLILHFPKISVKPRTKGQEKYLKKLNKSDIVIAIGPAGTGKTFLAVAKALDALLKREVKKIILTRPAVEAGENLGFLPGDLKEKVDPYLRPLYDALYAMLERDRVNRYIKDEIIEIAPLAYMRGRTLANSFLILDEAQNTTSMQMKMFLTRLGVNSKAIITGDITQIDLESHSPSGLIQLEYIVKDIKAIETVKLTSADVVRHPLVKDIINAYSEYIEK